MEREQPGAPDHRRPDDRRRAGTDGAPGCSHRSAGRLVCGSPAIGGSGPGAGFGDDLPGPPPGGAEDQYVPGHRSVPAGHLCGRLRGGSRQLFVPGDSGAHGGGRGGHFPWRHRGGAVFPGDESGGQPGGRPLKRQLHRHFGLGCAAGHRPAESLPRDQTGAGEPLRRNLSDRPVGHQLRPLRCAGTGI